ncbi:MAG: histidine ammonia-lyase [Candidatus Dormibacterales bacterium]
MSQRSDRAVVTIGDGDLSLDGYWSVAEGRSRVRLSPAARSRMEQHRASLFRQLDRGARIYGVNTGYGADSKRVLPQDVLRTVQRNTIVSHAVGVGDPAGERIVRGMMLLKANVLAQGYSAVRPAVAEALIEFLNHDILPIVPDQGSLAASGDLVPSGHLALALLGEGEVMHSGRRVPAAAALAAAGIPKLAPEEKEGLALVNGTVFTEAYALQAVILAERLLRVADVAGAATLQALKGHLAAFQERALLVRPHPGALLCAANVRALCQGSALFDGAPSRVHDPYCLRCIPQVHGASRDAFAYVKSAALVELNAVTDNPLVFESDDSWASAGNFHAQPIGIPMDTLAVTIAEIASVSQRRTQHLVAPVYDVGLPDKLSRRADSGSGLFMLNTTAAALVSENKALSFPASVDSMAVDTTEDHVSMGSVAARKAMAIIKNTANVLAIELICAMQAIDLHEPVSPSIAIGAVRDEVRRKVPFVDIDRALSAEIGLIAADVLSGSLVGRAETALGRSLL